MKATLLLATVGDYFRIGRRSLCIEGAPGGGKTSIVRQAARQLKVPCITIHMPTGLVEDFGVPDLISRAISDDDTSFGYRLPAWYPAKGGPLDNGRGGMLCFDDRNQADQSLQKVLANIIQDRTLHGVRMAPGWYPVSTGNRQSDRAGANRVLTHLRNRETVVTLDTDLDASTQWMLDHEVAPEVISFIRFRPGLLHDFDPTRDVNPSPRAWVEGVSDVLGRIRPEAEYECFSGAVGEGAAAEFTGYLRIYRDLDDPDDIIADPKRARVPSDSATLFALSGALAARATKANFAPVLTYAKRMPSEFTVLLVSMAVRTNDELCSTPAFIDWASEGETHALMWG